MNQFETVALIILFAMLFAVIGWYIPAIYATHAPQGYYIEAHDLYTEDATIGDEHHTVCFDRTVHRGSSGEVFARLYLVSDDGTRILADSENERWAFDDGRETVRVTVDIPEHVKPGVYQYELVYDMEVANGRSERQFSFESNTFNVTNNETATAYC